MGFTSAFKEYDNSSVLGHMASAAKIDLSANFRFNSGNPVNDAKAVAPALHESAAGLSQIQDMRHALAAQIGDPGAANPVSGAATAKPDPSNPMSFFRPGNLAWTVGGALAGMATGGLAGAGIMAAGAIGDAAGFMFGKSGAQSTGLIHEGEKHAAIDGGSELGKSLSDDGEKGGYVDVLGGKYGDDGQIVLTKKVVPAAQPAIDPKLQMAAAETVDKFGTEEIKRQLGRTSTMEERLLQQAGAAMDFAEDNGGPAKVAMAYKPVTVGSPAGPRLG